MPGRKERTHYKVQQLPEDLIAAVNERIVAGDTYTAITTHIRAMGHDVGRSSVARYGQQFLAKSARHQQFTELAKTLVAAHGTVDLEEVASKLALDLLLQALLDTEALGGELDICRTLEALAKVQSSAVQREKWKQELARRVEQAAQACEKTAKQGGLSEKAVHEIKARILGVAA